MSETIGQPEDFGPVYAETHMGRLPVEPCNTLSNLAFLFLVVFWAAKTKFNHRVHPLIVVALPILLLGFVGGTIYHATRSAYIWLLLDYMPILILVLAACVYLWRQVLGGWTLTFLATLGPICVYRFAVPFAQLPDNVHITVGYAVLASNILLPTLAHCLFRARRHWKWLCLSLLSFLVAVACRQGDATWGAELLPMGTHFLWHLGGAASAFFLFQYVYVSDLDVHAAGDAPPQESQRSPKPR